jgi:hypothetical protein
MTYEEEGLHGLKIGKWEFGIGYWEVGVDRLNGLQVDKTMQLGIRNGEG